MRKIKFITILIIMGLIVTGSLSVFAEKNNELDGRAIMKRVYERDTGEDRQSDLKMILVNRHEDERVREIRQFEKDFGEVEKKIMFFLSPKDVRNTSFMNWSYEDKTEDDQWLYLPAVRKIKRISGENKNDQFMGSDFTYDDMGERELDEDTHTLLREEEYRGQDCYVVESVPVEDDYMYSKTITWVDKKDWIGLKKEFYDPEGELLKTLKNQEYREVEGILTVFKSEMHNVQDDHRTIIELDNVDYNVGLSEDKFTERMMRRGL
ncbi:MAG: outer membrane lipoprotein-sorting protein [Bacillota bacterium]